MAVEEWERPPWGVWGGVVVQGCRVVIAVGDDAWVVVGGRAGAAAAMCREMTMVRVEWSAASEGRG